MRVLGVLCLLGYAVHVGVHVGRGHPENALWACHVGALLCGFGLVAQVPLWNAVGVFWLIAGLPLWLADLAYGGEFLPSTLLTHVVALVLGCVGVRRLGVPQGTWWRALLALMGLEVVTRVVTPPAPNVNMAHRVYDGSAHLFSSHAAYLAALTAGLALLFLALQAGLPRLCAAREEGRA